MRPLLLAIAIFSILMIFIYLFAPQLILKVISILRRYILDDIRIPFHRKKIILFYFTIFIASSLLYLTTGSKEPIHEAYKNFYQGKHDKALEICKKIYLKEPNNFKALELMGLIYLAMGDKKSARKYLMMAKKISPENKRIIKLLEKIK